MKKLLREIKSCLVIIFGNFIYACAVHFFLMQAELTTGGVTGISIALGEISPVSVAVYALILNVVMWLAGLILLGKHFAATTLLSTFAFPVLLGLLERFVPYGTITQDRLLCAVFGGILTGIGLGITMREKASTGGIDVIPLALNKYFRLPVSTTMYIIDVIILLSQAAVFPAESLLYGIINVLLCSVVLDKVLLFGQAKIELKIVSDRYEEITETVLKDFDRGVTLLKSQGGYTRNPGMMVLSVISDRELNKLEKRIHAIDENALIIINRVAEVSGRGFTMEKIYR